MAFPSPLHPTTISVLLQYISPPSQLTNPLPQHLISLPLLQRHFFLNLRDPSTDPASYLSWPSQDQQKIFDILESLPTPIDDHSPSPAIRYTGDNESAFAHAEIPSPSTNTDNIRLIFQWDERDSSWKYHNVALMPFPTHSFESPSSLTFLNDQSDDTSAMAPEHGSPFITVHHHDNNNDDEDSYWDAYGAADDERPNAGLTRTNSADPTSEDAYWAQYSSVHGTADSTRPSPPPTAKRKLGHFAESAETETDYLHDRNDFYTRDQDTVMSMTNGHGHSMQDVVDIPYQSFNIKRPYDRQSPPSPTELSERLRALSESSRSDDDALEVEGMKETQTIENDGGILFAPLANAAATTKKMNGHLSNGVTDSANSVKSDSNAALREAIRGTYLLWKLSGDGTGAGSGRESFLDVVKAAISDC
ncbi:hypothetical protein VNI00_001558 [Paramarasmius palmivorus]|uniref:Uncharacterized protein n=1 Tax=Paramarasmius palmivorus TaxID=297713 RepID=A0AAW0E7B8_9AGAR